MKKVLLIAYHFPPILVSSGLQRTLSMVRYARDSNWEPLVLSISPRAYPYTSDHQLKDIPEGVVVKRAFGLDAARQLSIKGRYPDIFALPDRWISWYLPAVCTGLSLIRKYRPNIIWSTYPIATAHRIGLTLNRLTGIPWVADFRDSMTEDQYPVNERKRKSYRQIERQAVDRASRLIFTAPGTLQMYRQRYSDCPEEKMTLVPNGYDEEIFSEAEKKAEFSERQNGPLTLLHSGILYASERDPTCFFKAIAQLKESGDISAADLRVVLRATGHEKLYHPILKVLDIEDIIVLLPGIAYQSALEEMLQADGLLLFQAGNCNHQIPAKLYEYFRAGKPVLAFTDRDGNTADLLRLVGIESIFPLNDVALIKNALLDFIKNPTFRKQVKCSLRNARKYSRQVLTKTYFDILDSVVG